jgi:hypothetical protein
LVIDQLRSTFTGQDVAIAFFYFDYHDQGYQSPANVVASILKQLASQKSILPLAVTELHKRFEKQQDHPQLQDLETTLLLTCQEFRQIFIIIDALDECDAKMHRKSFLKVLKELQNASVRVFVTSRPHPDDIKQELCASPIITVEASNSDIRKYLAHKIDQDGDKDLIDELLKKDIVTSIANGAQGMLVGMFRAIAISDHVV